MKRRLTVENAMELLDADPDREFANLLRRGSLSVKIFRPKEVDRQTPHEQDEVYVIISGTGYFAHDGERHEVIPGEVLFVPAGSEHRFEDFSEDFTTWVIFYGPRGGELS